MKIIIGGQLKKQEIKELVQKLMPDAVVDVKSDIEAAMDMQNNNYDYYLGACDTGGGGALAMVVSFIGVDKAKTVATQSSKKSEQEIIDMINEGVVAFGFVETEVEYCVEHIIKNIKGG